MISSVTARALVGACALPFLLGACSSLASDRGDVRDAAIVTAPDGDAIGVEQLARELRRYDVVFLGELHDSETGHLLMTDLTERILDGHRAPVLSMEMFERDVQDLVTAYAQGRLDRETFVTSSRAWGASYDAEADAWDTTSYDTHYGPVVDLAREHGWDVVAANVPRRDARAVARGEAPMRQPSMFASPLVDLSDGRYKRTFYADMGLDGDGGMHGHGGGMDAERFYAAQVVKDETMAHAIARLFERDGPWPRVVHWNGRYHSDWGLGTVERLRERRPDLTIAVVSMERGDARAVARSEDPPARWIIDVP